MINVLIVDDHKLVREGFRALLAQAKDITIIGEARNGQEAIELAEQLTPDIVLMDIKMPTLNGLEATKWIQSHLSSTQVLIISMSWDESLVHRALNNGAKGFLSKDDSFAELLSAIRVIREGKTYLSNRVTQALAMTN